MVARIFPLSAMVTSPATRESEMPVGATIVPLLLMDVGAWTKTSMNKSAASEMPAPAAVIRPEFVMPAPMSPTPMEMAAAPAEIVPELTMVPKKDSSSRVNAMAVPPALMMPLPLLVISLLKSKTVLPRIALPTTDIVPELTMPPETEPSFSKNMPFPPLRIVPELVIEPEKVETRMM